MAVTIKAVPLITMAVHGIMIITTDPAWRITIIGPRLQHRMLDQEAVPVQAEEAVPVQVEEEADAGNFKSKA